MIVINHDRDLCAKGRCSPSICHCICHTTPKGKDSAETKQRRRANQPYPSPTGSRILDVSTPLTPFEEWLVNQRKGMDTIPISEVSRLSAKTAYSLALETHRELCTLNEQNLISTATEKARLKGISEGGAIKEKELIAAYDRGVEEGRKTQHTENEKEMEKLLNGTWAKDIRERLWKGKTPAQVMEECKKTDIDEEKLAEIKAQVREETLKEVRGAFNKMASVEFSDWLSQNLGTKQGGGEGMKHVVKQRTRTYEQGDFYLYHIECSCGNSIGAWTQQWAEGGYQKHLAQNTQPPKGGLSHASRAKEGK